MDQVEFDRFADEYYEQHRENVAVTGENPEYFAEYKIKKLKQIVDRSNIRVSRICDFAPGLATRSRSFGRTFPRPRLHQPTCPSAASRSAKSAIRSSKIIFLSKMIAYPPNRT